jgi:hypothetical protein
VSNELDKIDFFYKEGRRLWQSNPDYVLTKDFYELWESLYSPQPFAVEDSIELMGIKFDLPEYEGEKIAYYSWLNGDKCPALLVETEEWEKRYLLTFADGDARIYENDLILFSDDDYSMGEKLEVVMEAVSYLRRHEPGKNILTLTKKDFLAVLTKIAALYPPGLVNLMRNSSAVFIKNLIRKATADMAADELSRQLSLPLDGDYSFGVGNDIDRLELMVASADIPARTPWQIQADMEFINQAYRLATESEVHFVLPLKDAEVIGPAGKFDVPLKININAEMPIRQNDILNVFLRGEKAVLGTFKVDIFDEDKILGRLRCDYPRDVSRQLKRMFIRLQRSPREFLTNTFGQLYHSFCAGDGIERSQSALKYILGFKSFTFKPGRRGVPAVAMDASQQSAWRSAIDPANPLVLIQGPPGTGKTFCLEQLVRTLCARKLRILITAASNTAVDNICRRISDLPVLRFGKTNRSIAPDVAAQCWVGEGKNVKRFVMKRQQMNTGGIYAGTQVGLLREDIISDDMKQNGCYDVVIFDEAGMSNMEEFLLCARFGKRAILFGDHLQLPPFPLPRAVIAEAGERFGPLSRQREALIKYSALEWLTRVRKVPVIMLQRSYRCQNPRLLRFASTLFYDAGVLPSSSAEYFKLSYHERKDKYPPSTLRFLSTSALPEEKRREHLAFERQRPGIANPVEAGLCLHAFYRAVEKYPLEEISIIAPYRRQVKLIRDNISLEKVRSLCPDQKITDRRWYAFVNSRIATVDSFQGAESDIVIICYVRSNKNDGIGFVDNPNRINVAHTRCRREIVIIGDLEGLKRQARTNIFARMARAFARDGELIELSEDSLSEICEDIQLFPSGYAENQRLTSTLRN